MKKGIFKRNVKEFYIVFEEKQKISFEEPSVKTAAFIPDSRPITQYQEEQNNIDFLEEKEQPPAYILVATEDVNPNRWQFEAGAVCTSIMLLAKEKGLETCCIGNFDKAKIAELLGVDTSRYSLLYLIAIGPSSQQNRICPVTEGIKYTYENGTFTVPKYDLSEILL